MRLTAKFVQIIFLFPIGIAGCKSEDPGSSSAPKSPMKLLEEVKDGTKIDPSGPNTSENIVPAADVESLEIVLAERESVGDAPPDLLVYAVLYDKDQSMVASGGALDLTYTVAGTKKTKQIQILPEKFRDQIIPGEEESTLTLMIDVLSAPPPGTIVVSARFDSRIETETTLEDEPEEASVEE